MALERRDARNAQQFLFALPKKQIKISFLVSQCASSSSQQKPNFSKRNVFRFSVQEKQNWKRSC